MFSDDENEVDPIARQLVGLDQVSDSPLGFRRLPEPSAATIAKLRGNSSEPDPLEKAFDNMQRENLGLPARETRLRSERRDNESTRGLRRAAEEADDDGATFVKAYFRGDERAMRRVVRELVES